MAITAPSFDRPAFRAWAREAGKTVGARGRLNHLLVAEYLIAHRDVLRAVVKEVTVTLPEGEKMPTDVKNLKSPARLEIIAKAAAAAVCGLKVD
jgi:Xaa-Pro aminopeptidase